MSVRRNRDPENKKERRRRPPEDLKRIIRFFLGLIILGVETAAYQYVWRRYYNIEMEVPYNRTGHWLMAAVYLILLLIFNSIYGGLRVGYLRTRSMIWSQAIASLCGNVMIYLQITLLTKHFQKTGPLLALYAFQIAAIALWSVISTRIYRAVYPPRKVLLVYGDRPAAGLMRKMAGREDRFEVVESMRVTDTGDGKTGTVCAEDVMSKIGQYEGVVICDMPSRIRNRILKYCYGKSIRTYTTPNISDILLKSAESIHMFDTPLLLNRNAGLTLDQRFVKRIFDIAVSTAALILLSPVFLLTAVCIKAYDGGPVFFRQDRCTKDGKVFSIIKFRSMIVNAEKEGRSVPATDKDPRITRVGRFIRRMRIDELPQFFNILKGDMSVVGPRPERVEHVRLYTSRIPEFSYRFKVKGGLTGYAQVYGKYNTTAYDKLKLDLMYIQNYSVLLDIKIVMKTIETMFAKESTEGFEKETSQNISREYGNLKYPGEEK